MILQRTSFTCAAQGQKFKEKRTNRRPTHIGHTKEKRLTGYPYREVPGGSCRPEHIEEYGTYYINLCSNSIGINGDNVPALMSAGFLPSKGVRNYLGSTMYAAMALSMMKKPPSEVVVVVLRPVEYLSVQELLELQV